MEQDRSSEHFTSPPEGDEPEIPPYETPQGRALRQREDKLFAEIGRLRDSAPDPLAPVEKQWEYAEETAQVRDEAEEIKLLHEEKDRQ